MTIRVGFLTTHPIQYQVPIFRLLAEEPEIDLTVMYGMLPDGGQQGAGFGIEFEWDVPLLDGYKYEVLRNVSPAPSVTAFGGCDTPGIGEVLRRRRLDVLIVNGWVVKSCLQGLRAAGRLGIPCLVRGEANSLRPRAWWKRLVHRQLLKRYAGFLCIGEANRAFYRSHNVREEMLFRAPYCIDNDRFGAEADRRNGERAAIRKRLGIAPDIVCFLFCGKFEAKKHPLELLQAFAAAVQSGAEAQLLMVGDGELRKACEAYAEERQLPAIFSGFLNQSEIIDAYVACDCLVLPSDHGETWGLVVNEAMACGRPAVVSDQVGCTQDLIVAGQTGETFAFGNWPALSAKLCQLASESDLLVRMGRAARERIVDYAPQTAADGILEAVRNVAGESSTRRTTDTEPEIRNTVASMDGAQP